MKQSARLAYIHLAGRGTYAPAFFVNWRNHRAALIILLLFVFFVISVNKHDITAGIIYAVFPVMLITAGRLPIAPILKRLALISPFVLIMAAANPLLDTHPYIKINTMVISSGIVSGTVILIKSLVTISAVLAFTLCVPFYRICEILRDFRVPNVFVTQLVLLYRYSFLLVEEAMAMQKARNLRSFGKKGKDLFTTAKLIGSLLLRTNNKAERIYRGMIARGFNGELTKKKIDKIRIDEVVLTCAALLVFTLIRVIF
ncbi:MAG: cobalt ECF transporter T component CbiQ [Fibrobacter sp.]|jgi:cobalt/nickel transport system permease protein|nr:cobalt ECF transporter T component CbiQ [Fibrobacter sp.]